MEGLAREPGSKQLLQDVGRWRLYVGEMASEHNPALRVPEQNTMLFPGAEKRYNHWRRSIWTMFCDSAEI